jgi:hypothetical protein
VTDDADRNRVRAAAAPLLQAPVASLSEVAEFAYPVLTR